MWDGVVERGGGGASWRFGGHTGAATWSSNGLGAPDPLAQIITTLLLGTPDSEAHMLKILTATQEASQLVARA